MTPCEGRIPGSRAELQTGRESGSRTRAVLVPDINRNDMNENGGRSYQFPKDMWFRPPETEENG